MPLIMPNFIALGQSGYEKSVTNFFTLSLFWRSRGSPGPKFTSLGSGSKAPSTNLPNFVPFWKPLCDISAAKYRRFLWRRDPHKTVNDIVSALPCGDNNETWFSHRELFCLGTFLLHPAGLYQTQMTVTEATYFIRAYIHKSIIYCQNKKNTLLTFQAAVLIVRNSTVYRDTVSLLRWLLYFFMTRIMTIMTMIRETRY